MVTKAAGSGHFRPIKLPADASTLALGPDPCHCVADTELDNRYNILRAEEHARFEGKCGPEWSTDVARRPENAERNRYPSVVPWDHSRVKLPVKDGENDYINASWIELGSRTYIASQGPLQSTVPDFWQMVYAYGGEPAVVIMLTPLHEHAVEKCAKYWPDSKSVPVEIPAGGRFKFGLTTHLESVHKSDKYHISTFKLQPTDTSMPARTVQHVYYHSWLDYSKPDMDADLREIVHIVNNRLRNRASPLIVHCSAGIGRTGTFIAMDALLSRIDTDIVPAIMPRIVPLWRADQRVLQFRDSLFTGMADHHSDTEETAPRLSKFDVKAQSTAASLATLQTSTAEPSQRPGPRESKLSQALAREAPAAAMNGNANTISEDADEEDNLEPEAPASSAKTGPPIKKVAPTVTSVSPEVFSQTPNTIDVVDWYKIEDPVMSAIRTIRMQRPKMVQGKQQLGYIYDQFEVGQQLARATFQDNQLRSRSSTFNSVNSTSSAQAATPSSSSSSRSRQHRFLSLIGVRRSSNSSKSDQETSPSSHHRKLFSLHR